METTLAPRRFSYESCLRASEKIDWTVDDLIGPDAKLDFERPFLPESLARVEELDFLTPTERRTLNQIRGHGYLCTFGLVEEFILPFVMDHARPSLGSDRERTQALLNFASEEAKHIHLFDRFRQAFVDGFGVDCGVIGPPSAIAEHVMAQHPLGIALLILHIEWMTQRHYVDSVKDDGTIDPLFTSLLKHHWMEEAQHAKLDTLMVEEMAASMSPAEIERGMQAYLELGAFLDEGLSAQAAMDLDALQQAEQIRLTDAQREEFLRVQHQALRWTYIGTGITHPEFLTTVERLAPAWKPRMMEAGRMFS